MKQKKKKKKKEIEVTFKEAVTSWEKKDLSACSYRHVYVICSLGKDTGHSESCHTSDK